MREFKIFYEKKIAFVFLFHQSICNVQWMFVQEYRKSAITKYFYMVLLLYTLFFSFSNLKDVKMMEEEESKSIYRQSNNVYRTISRWKNERFVKSFSSLLLLLLLLYEKNENVHEKYGKYEIWRGIIFSEFSRLTNLFCSPSSNIESVIRRDVMRYYIIVHQLTISYKKWRGEI